MAYWVCKLWLTAEIDVSKDLVNAHVLFFFGTVAQALFCKRRNSILQEALFSIS
jgi:hypothetical protein